MAPPPRRAVEDGVIRYGRYCYPIQRPKLDAPGPLGRMRLKQWHYTSVVTEECFLAVGLVQLGYLANAFCYFVDRRKGGQSWDHEALLPLGAGLHVAPSSVDGCTSYRRGGARAPGAACPSRASAKKAQPPSDKGGWNGDDVASGARGLRSTRGLPGFTRRENRER